MLSQEQVDFYKENGYILIKGLFDSALVEELRRESDAAIDRASSDGHANALWQGDWIKEEERKKTRLDAIHDMQFQASAFGRILYHQGLLDAAESLIGPNVQLHHTKLLAKPAGVGGGFPMHQDYPYFPHRDHSMMAVSVYLDDADEENGCIRVVPGSHKLGPLETAPKALYLPQDKYPLEDSVAAPSKAGDALFFNYLTIHGSGANKSTRQRRNILFQLRDPADPPLADIHPSRGQGMMLRGINPGYVDAPWEEKQKV